MNRSCKWPAEVCWNKKFYLLKKWKLNVKCIHINFDKDSSFRKKSLLPLEWTIYAKQFQFSMRDLVGTNKVNKHLPTRADTHKVSLNEINLTYLQWAIETLLNNSFIEERGILPFEWTICVKQSWRYNFFH